MNRALRTNCRGWKCSRNRWMARAAFIRGARNSREHQYKSPVERNNRVFPRKTPVPERIMIASLPSSNHLPQSRFQDFASRIAGQRWNEDDFFWNFVIGQMFAHEVLDGLLLQ